MHQPQNGEQQSKYDFVVVMSFDRRDVNPHIETIKEGAAYIPKFWSVDDQDRQFIVDLFADPKVNGGSIRFAAAVECTEERQLQLVELVQEVLNRAYDKDYLLPAGGKMHCNFALGGLKDHVLNSYQEMSMRSHMLIDNESAGKAQKIASQNGFSVFNEDEEGSLAQYHWRDQGGISSDVGYPSEKEAWFGAYQEFFETHPVDENEGMVDIKAALAQGRVYVRFNTVSPSSAYFGRSSSASNSRARSTLSRVFPVKRREI